LTLATVPIRYSPFSVGSSSKMSFCVIRKTRWSPFMASSSAFTDFSRPTSKWISCRGNTVSPRKGSTGIFSEIKISLMKSSPFRAAAVEAALVEIHGIVGLCPVESAQRRQ